MTGLVASVAVAVSPAQASTFTYNGTNYDITTVTGSYGSLSSQLSSTPWYNDFNLASGLLGVVKTSLGTPNTGDLDTESPYFVSLYTFSPGNTFPLALSYSTGGTTSSSGVSPGMSGTFAVGSVASAVPEPLTILGAVTAAGFGAGFKRKLAKSQKQEDQKDA